MTSSGTEGSTRTPVREMAHPAKPDRKVTGAESQIPEVNYSFWEKRQGQKTGMRLEYEKGGKRLEVCSVATPLQPEGGTQDLREGQGEEAEDRRFSVHSPRTSLTANAFMPATPAAPKGLPRCPCKPEPSPRTL